MYPAYPFLLLNAAIALHLILTWTGKFNPKEFIGKVPAQLKLAIVVGTVAVAISAGFLRIYGTVSAYRAPLLIYEALNSTNPGDLVCFGKDWYRFPTSHFLPHRIHAKFIKSEFDGLLPGDFSEAEVGFGFYPGTWLIPPGMNDRNEEDYGKYIDIHHCTYLVDSVMPDSRPTPLELLFAIDKEWEKMHCAPFLDALHTGLLARTIWIPDLPIIPAKYRRVWGEHCLLKRRG